MTTALKRYPCLVSRCPVPTSLARPDGNVTGVPYGFGLETIVKGLELLKEIAGMMVKNGRSAA